MGLMHNTVLDIQTVQAVLLIRKGSKVQGSKVQRFRVSGSEGQNLEPRTLEPFMLGTPISNISIEDMLAIDCDRRRQHASIN